MAEKIPYAYGRNMTFFRELTEGETWRPHPSGNGIIVAHPERPPMWCRAENNALIQDYIGPSLQPSGEQP
jgi:hypothetical protein